MITVNLKQHPFFKEKPILFPVILLCGLGIIMVYSASSAIGHDSFGSHYHFVKRQALFCGVSIVVMFILASFPYRYLKAFAYILLGMALLLLFAVMIPSMGVSAGGACRWLKIAGVSFQPSEFAKLALIVFLAYSLSKKQEMIKLFSVGFVPHVILFATFAALIIIQPDFGTVVILGAITWGMMFMAGVRVTHLLLPVPLLIPFLYFFVYKVDYRMDRIFAFLNPWADPMDTGYQITHSLKAFGSGGIFGKGIGLGMQKLHYLPEPHTDFIFSVVGEELGLIGVLVILLLYAIILYRGAAIAREADTLFGSFVAAGLTLSIGLQVIINIGVTMGVLPTKGLTLPFLSYGGTSLLLTMAAMGILMNIGASKNHG